MDKYNFDIIIEDITSKYKKIRQDDYLEEGSYPIIDQGKAFIAGFSNKIANENNDYLPLIIFGDHTKAIKYVDFPFNIGADGVKVLNVNKSIAYPKYVYYFFKTISLPDAGYSRHFKFLKKLEISLPSYENQIRIARLLEKIEATIFERKNAIDLLDELVKATFYQMFGDPVKNEKGWRLLDGFNYANDIQVGVVVKPASYYVNEGVIALRSLNVKPNKIDLNDVVYFSEATNITTLSKSILKRNDIVLVRTGNTGVAAIVPEELDGANCIDLIICRPKKELVISYYLVYLYNSDRFQKVVENNEVGGVHKHLNIGVLKSIDLPIPPITLQNQFAEIAQKIENIKTEQEVQLRNLEELYASISHKVFAGDIDLSKVPFDASLIPNAIEVPQEESIEKPVVVEQKDAPKKEIEKVKSKENIKGLKFGFQVVRHLESWEHYSFKEIADSIIKHFSMHYFNAEMILNFLDKELDIQVNYYSSAEQKKNPQYQNADDFYRFIATALTGENIFLTLEQVFYNAETENIANISFTERDVENLSKKDKKERSGIYFRIKDEATTT